MADGVGTIIARWLSAMDIRYEEPGCNCYKTMIAMNRSTPERILNDMDRWVETIKESSKLWRKSENCSRTKRVILVLIKPFEECAIEKMIRAACEESLKQREPVKV